MQGACSAHFLALKCAESTAHQPELRAQRLPEPRALEEIAHLQHCSLTDEHPYNIQPRVPGSIATSTGGAAQQYTEGRTNQAESSDAAQRKV